MEYLRFGAIPKNGKSVNFLKLTNEQSENFTFFIEIGDIDYAYESVPDSALEDGVSCFSIVDGLPELSNIRLASALAVRLNEPVYLVTGNVVSYGRDGEPLISVDSFKEISIDKDTLISYLMDSLKNHYKVVQANNCDSLFDRVYRFASGDSFYYSFGGYDFYSPVNKDWE